MLYELARPLLFSFSPEAAHALAFGNLARARKLGLSALLRPHLPDDPVEAMGLRFPNPVGLAAGLDKNGEYIDALGDLGFGHLELGTVTPLAQPGNPRPRAFRIVAAQGLINRMGFNNEGIDRFVANVAASRGFSARGGVLGLNIGKNAATPIERAADDYLICLRKVYPLLVERAGYIAVNISSPNTRDLRSLQGGAALERLLAALRTEIEALTGQYGKRVALAVKIAPDLEEADVARIARSLRVHEIDGLIATNTTLARAGIEGLPHAAQAGGLSGAPLREHATAVIRAFAAELAGKIPILGAGGIMSGADAVEKIEAGARLVQLYTGLIYRGPGLVGECRRAIAAHRTTQSAAAAPRP